MATQYIMLDSVVSFLGLSVAIPAEVKQLLMAASFGMAVGFERALRRKAASLRTFSLLSSGSCLFTLLGVAAAGGVDAPHADATRVAAQIVTGVGFLGGGVIFKTTDRIEGVTTGAMIWFTSALGMACGFNHVDLAVWSFIVYFLIQIIAHFIYRSLDLMGIAHPSRGRSRIMQPIPKEES